MRLISYRGAVLAALGIVAGCLIWGAAVALGLGALTGVVFLSFGVKLALVRQR